MGGTVVCGVTETPDGRSAAELAHALQTRLGLRLVLVHVLEGVQVGTHESLSARETQAGAQQMLNEVALAIGAVMPGRWASHAMATWVGVTPSPAATFSTAARTVNPRSVM